MREALNIPRIGTEDRSGGRWRIARRVGISIRASLWRSSLLRWAQSRTLLLRSLIYRIQELKCRPVGWSMEFAPDLVGETGYKWTHDCTSDTLRPLADIPWTDQLDYEIAVQAWRRGAEWGYRNACSRSDKQSVQS